MKNFTTAKEAKEFTQTVNGPFSFILECGSKWRAWTAFQSFDLFNLMPIWVAVTADSMKITCNSGNGSSLIAVEGIYGQFVHAT